MLNTLNHVTEDVIKLEESLEVFFEGYCVGEKRLPVDMVKVARLLGVCQPSKNDEYFDSAQIIH